MGTVDKALRLLRLFTPEDPQWTVEGAANRLGIPTSTAYRYFRSLTGAGLLVDFASGRYVIGPGIFELDRIARRTDPLILAAQSAMDDLTTQDSRRNIVLLSRLYRGRVMCVDRRSEGRRPMTISYERGRLMPLYRGSVSKIILANLNSRTISRYYNNDHEEIAKAGLGTDMQAFRGNLRTIRRAGFCISHGEVDSGVIGISAPIAAPIATPDGEVFASISLVIPDESEHPQDPTALVPFVLQAARKTESTLRELTGRTTD